MAKKGKANTKRNGDYDETKDQNKYGKDYEDNPKSTSSNGRKGKKNGGKYRGKRSGNSSSNSSDHSTNYNDPAWYVPDLQLLKDVASFPFSDRLGMPIKFTPNANSNAEFYDGCDMPQPGIASLNVVPYVGTTIANGEAPVNIAGRMLYQEMRKANSGSTNYDWPDVMMYFLTMDNCYMLWAFLRRIYGVARQYQYRNAYVPNKLLASMGVKPECVMGVLPQLRYLINQLALKLTSYPVPAVMTYFVRHRWMFEKLWVDGLTSKSQIYLFNPKLLYFFDDSTTPVSLAPFDVVDYLNSEGSSDSNAFLAAVQYIISSFTDVLPNNTDIAVISGDVLKAYGPASCFMLPMTDEDYFTETVYSEEVLRQIHNATILTVTDKDAATRLITINPFTNNIYQDLYAGAPDVGVHNVEEWLVNLDLDEVSPADFMVSTRLTSLVKDFDINAGDMIVDNITLYVNTKDQGFMSSVIHMDSNTISGVTNTITDLGNVMGLISAASNFRYFPLLYLEHKASSNSAHPDFRGMLGDLNNFTVLDSREAQRLHQASFMGLFGIPYGIYLSRSKFTGDKT